MSTQVKNTKDTAYLLTNSVLIWCKLVSNIIIINCELMEYQLQRRFNLMATRAGCGHH